MSNSVHSVQAANKQAQTEQTVQPPKTPQSKTQNAVPQDKVTISQAAQKALAGNTKSSASSDVDHDGDSH